MLNWHKSVDKYYIALIGEIEVTVRIEIEDGYWTYRIAEPVPSGGYLWALEEDHTAKRSAELAKRDMETDDD